nr:GIY-YIG nuclease family protein [Nevskia soli]
MSAKRESKTQRPWLLYLLECAGDKLYIGISPDPEARFQLHLRGTGAKYTRANPPLRILAAQVYADRSAASAAEYALKQLRRDAKLLWARERAWPLAAKVAAKKAVAKKAVRAKRPAAGKAAAKAPKTSSRQKLR